MGGWPPDGDPNVPPYSQNHPGEETRLNCRVHGQQQRAQQGILRRDPIREIGGRNFHGDISPPQLRQIILSIQSGNQRGQPAFSGSGPFLQLLGGADRTPFIQLTAIQSFCPKVCRRGRSDHADESGMVQIRAEFDAAVEEFRGKA